jgi:hypothetical protein
MRTLITRAAGLLGCFTTPCPNKIEGRDVGWAGCVPTEGFKDSFTCEHFHRIEGESGGPQYVVCKRIKRKDRKAEATKRALAIIQKAEAKRSEPPEHVATSDELDQVGQDLITPP